MTRKRLALWTTRLLCSLVAVSGSGVSGQDGYELPGRVVDETSGAPVPGAIVTSMSSDSVQSVLTGADGRFVIRSRVRIDSLSVRALGYQATAFAPPTGAEQLGSFLILPLTRVPIELEGIEVRATLVVDLLDTRLKAAANLNSYVIGADALREHDDLSGTYEALRREGVGVQTGCDRCFMRGGRFAAVFYIDERRVEMEEFRMVRTGELCRMEVVRTASSATGQIRAYTCDFLAAAAAGRKTIPLTNIWN